ncbi:hypothetical protein KFL_012760020 [Klebsormidium nitens]|uniref:Uncharacterized protein n=1 Tax=Klebsormidium nitens TaxID=105231 RepID=A0A1Y1IU09_KLENI|nr:hypothetical protein KFL_012760020 [Klebsormidium nitens]|eukprot:GAQ93059.1 hypothetical protein KFL_012760020 [Klebsormidium nitens]
MNPSNDPMEGANGTGKQFLRARPNATNAKASSFVAYKCSGMDERGFEAVGDKRKAHGWAMKEGRRIRKESTKNRELAEHGQIQADRADEEGAVRQARLATQAEQLVCLAGLPKCQSAVDVQTLYAGPSAFSPQTDRRKRLVDQLKRLKIVDGMKDITWSKKGQTIPVLWGLLCEKLQLGTVVMQASQAESGGQAGVAETELDPEIESEDDGGSEGRNDPVGSEDGEVGDREGVREEVPLAPIAERALSGDEEAFGPAVYEGGWEEAAFFLPDESPTPAERSHGFPEWGVEEPLPIAGDPSSLTDNEHGANLRRLSIFEEL